jgi:hypothetical protein
VQKVENKTFLFCGFRGQSEPQDSCLWIDILSFFIYRKQDVKNVFLWINAAGSHSAPCSCGINTGDKKKVIHRHYDEVFFSRIGGSPFLPV